MCIDFKQKCHILLDSSNHQISKYDIFFNYKIYVLPFCLMLVYMLNEPYRLQGKHIAILTFPFFCFVVF